MRLPAKEKFNIPLRAFEDIIGAAEKYGIDKVVLFGSRARGSLDDFCQYLNQTMHSLLMTDIVCLERASGELLCEIERDGITIYEKA